MMKVRKNDLPGAHSQDVMTASEVAGFLKVSIGAVRHWTRDGKLKGHRLGGMGDWRYLKNDVMSFFYGEPAGSHLSSGRKPLESLEEF